MKKILFLILCITSSLAVINDDEELSLTEEEKIKLRPKPSHIEQCKEGYPYLGVGDFNLTNENYTK
jgi:hypothetical protein